MDQRRKKRIKDLNICTKTIKLLEENIGVDLCDSGLGNGFLDMTPKAQATKEKRMKRIEDSLRDLWDNI